MSAAGIALAQKAWAHYALRLRVYARRTLSEAMSQSLEKEERASRSGPPEARINKISLFLPVRAIQRFQNQKENQKMSEVQ